MLIITVLCFHLIYLFDTSQQRSPQVAKSRKSLLGNSLVFSYEYFGFYDNLFPDLCYISQQMSIFHRYLQRCLYAFFILFPFLPFLSFSNIFVLNLYKNVMNINEKITYLPYMFTIYRIYK